MAIEGGVFVALEGVKVVAAAFKAQREFADFFAEWPVIFRAQVQEVVGVIALTCGERELGAVLTARGWLQAAVKGVA